MWYAQERYACAGLQHPLSTGDQLYCQVLSGVAALHMLIMARAQFVSSRVADLHVVCLHRSVECTAVHQQQCISIDCGALLCQ